MCHRLLPPLPTAACVRLVIAPTAPIRLDALDTSTQIRFLTVPAREILRRPVRLWELSTSRRNVLVAKTSLHAASATTQRMDQQLAVGISFREELMRNVGKLPLASHTPRSLAIFAEGTRALGQRHVRHAEALTPPFPPRLNRVHGTPPSPRSLLCTIPSVMSTKKVF